MISERVNSDMNGKPATVTFSCAPCVNCLNIDVDMTAPFRLRLDYWVNRIRSSPSSTDRDDAKEEAEKVAQLQLDPPA